MENVVPEMPQSQLVNVIDPDTQEVGSLPVSQLQDALSQGYTQASPEETLKFVNQQKFGTPGQQLLTGIEGAASAASFGLIPGGEHARERAETNPWSRGIGEVGGLALSNIIPGVGEFADLQEAAKAAQAAVKAGSMGVKEAAPVITAAKEAINPLSAQSIMSGVGNKAAKAIGLGGEDAGYLSQVGASATKVGVESALFQSGDEISKMMSNDPDQTIQTAVTNIGLAGLIGGGLGLGFGVTSPLWNAKVGSKMGQFIEDFKGRIKEHMDNPNPVSSVQEELGSLYDTAKSMNDEVWGSRGLKAQEIQKLMPEFNQKILQQGVDTVDKLKQTIEKMVQKTERYPPRLTMKLQDELKVLQDGLTSNSSSDFFNRLQEFKQQLQGLSFSKFGELEPFHEAYDFVRDIKSLGKEVRQGLENPEVWGKAAERQQAINGAFKTFLPTLQDFEKTFTTKIAAEETGGFKRIIDPGKVNTYMNQLGKPNAEIKQTKMENFIREFEKYKDAIDKTHVNLGLENPFSPSSLTQAKKTLNELTPGAKVADTMVKKGLARLGGEGIGATIGGGIGHMFGSTLLGALVGEHALAPFFSSILPGLIKPILENPSSSGGLKHAVELGLSVVKGESLVNKAAKNVFKAGVDVLPSHLIPNDRARMKLDKAASAYQQNPEKMFDIGGKAGHYLPKQAQSLGQLAANSVNYINSLRPSIDKKAPLDSDTKPSNTQTSAYQRQLAIAEQPLAILKHIKDGNLLPQDIMTLHTLYPSLHQKLVQKLTDEMVSHLTKGEMIPYKTRLGLSLFMGQPLDSTMTPEAIQAAQPLVPQTPQGQMPQRSMSALNKMALSDQTPSQARERHRASKN